MVINKSAPHVSQIVHLQVTATCKKQNNFQVCSLLIKFTVHVFYSYVSTICKQHFLLSCNHNARFSSINTPIHMQYSIQLYVKKKI